MRAFANIPFALAGYSEGSIRLDPASINYMYMIPAAVQAVGLVRSNKACFAVPITILVFFWHDF